MQRTTSSIVVSPSTTASRPLSKIGRMPCSTAARSIAASSAPLEDQAVDRSARHQQFGDRAPAAKAGAAALAGNPSDETA